MIHAGDWFSVQSLVQGPSSISTHEVISYITTGRSHYMQINDIRPAVLLSWKYTCNKIRIAILKYVPQIH